MRFITRKVGIIPTIYLSVLLVASMLLGFNCSGFAPVGDMQGQNSLSSVTDPGIPIALLSSEQILKTMLAATGTENAGSPTPADDLILKTYTERSGSLPSEQGLSQATGPMQISVANLASAVCAKAVANEMAIAESSRDSRLFFREFDFSKGLDSQSTAAIVSGFDRLARNSWRRDTTDAEKTLISNFATEFSTGANQTDPAQTSLIATSICTIVLSSIDALTY
jgi:hypothetical protein